MADSAAYCHRLRSSQRAFCFGGATDGELPTNPHLHMEGCLVL